METERVGLCIERVIQIPTHSAGSGLASAVLWLLPRCASSLALPSTDGRARRPFHFLLAPLCASSLALPSARGVARCVS